MSSKKSFHYFGNTEHQTQNLWAGQRDKFFNFIFTPFKALGITPNILTFASLVCLIPIPFIYTALPWGVAGLLILYSIFDSLDGSYARWSGVAGKAGSILDIANDQLGLLLICFLVLHIGISPGWLVLLYAILYILMIVFAIILNDLGEPTHILFRSKYWLYFFFILFSFKGWDLITPLMLLTCPMMLWSCLRDYFQLWLHFRERQQRKLLTFSNKIQGIILLMVTLIPSLLFYFDNHSVFTNPKKLKTAQWIEKKWKKLTPSQSDNSNIIALTTLSNQKIIALEKLPDKQYKISELIPQYSSYKLKELFQQKMPFTIDDIAINPYTNHLYLLAQNHPTILSLPLDKNLKALPVKSIDSYQVFPRNVTSISFIGESQLLISFSSGSTHLGVIPTPETIPSKYIAAKLLSQNHLLMPALLNDSLNAYHHLWIVNQGLFSERMILQFYQNLKFGDRYLNPIEQKIQLPFKARASIALRVNQLIAFNREKHEIWVMQKDWEKIIKEKTP